MSIRVVQLFDAKKQLLGLSSIDLDAIESFLKQRPKLGMPGSIPPSTALS